MAEWLVAAVVALVLAVAMPLIVRSAKTSRGKGRMGGVAMVLGLAFSAFLDPAKREAMENIEDQKQRGGESTGIGERID